MSKIILVTLFFSLAFTGFANAFAGGTDIHGGQPTPPKPAPRPMPPHPQPGPTVKLVGPEASDFFAEMIYLHRDFYNDRSLNATSCTVTTSGDNQAGVGTLSYSQLDANQPLIENLSSDDSLFLCKALTKAGIDSKELQTPLGDTYTLTTERISCTGSPVVTECDIWIAP